jgi:5-methylcytosine-specific restriction endonuclease McrA
MLTQLRPDSNGMVTVIPSEKCSVKFKGFMKYQKALTHVKEGSCEIINSNTVIKLLSRKQLRQLVFERDNYTCHYCGEYGQTIDHIIPKSRGGCSTLVNMTCACHKCNQEKKSMSYIEYMKLIGKEVK